MTYSYDRTQDHTAATKLPKGWPEMPMVWDQYDMRKLPPLTYKGKKTQTGSGNALDLFLDFGDMVVAVRPPLESHHNTWDGRAIIEGQSQMVYGEGTTFEDAVKKVLERVRKGLEETVSYQKKKLDGLDNEYENAVQELKRKFEKQRERHSEILKQAEGRLKATK